jgi:hypothetical protein
VIADSTSTRFAGCHGRCFAAPLTVDEHVDVAPDQPSLVDDPPLTSG